MLKKLSGFLGLNKYLYIFAKIEKLIKYKKFIKAFNYVLDLRISI